MKCTHCFINATPNGKHMDMNVFEDVISFIRKIRPNVLLLSGGEPSEHPNFIQIIQDLKKVLRVSNLLLIATNGMFLYNEELTQKVLDMDVNIQITNDERFYPQRVPIIKHEKIFYETRIGEIFPLGRAVENQLNRTDMDRKSQAPKCFNVRSLVRGGHVNTFRDLIAFTELRLQKFCVPSIDIYGDLHIGETDECYKIGSIYDKEESIFENIRDLKFHQCNKCGLEDNLVNQYRKILS